MKLIMENWRTYLSEGMKTIKDLPENVYITIEELGEDEILIYYSHNKTGGVLNPKGVEAFQGSIRLQPVQLADEYPCMYALMIAHADATKGWGPLLYDVAIEYSTIVAGGLVSDRTIVSDEAYAVWDYYLKNRTDVTRSQLDNEEGELTPKVKKDDCLQNSTHDHISKTNNSWTENPLSKSYKKRATTMKALGDRLVTIGLDKEFLGL